MSVRDCLFLIVIFVLFSCTIVESYNYSEYKEDFKVRCEEAGGLMFAPYSRYRVEPECINPTSIININAGTKLPK